MTTTYLTIDEVAGVLRVSDKTVRRLLERQAIPGAFRLAPATTSSWRIPEEGLDEFIRARQAECSTPIELAGDGRARRRTRTARAA